MSPAAKTPRCPTTRFGVRWFRRVPSHELTMLGMPEFAAASCCKADTSPGKCFWQS